MVPIFAGGDQVSEPERILVEPVSEDDWELLVMQSSFLTPSSSCLRYYVLQERHPDDVEQQLLNQIKIVYEQQVFPYWIDRQHLIRLRVGATIFKYGT